MLTVRVTLGELGQWRDILVVSGDKVLGRLAATKVCVEAAANDITKWQLELDGYFVRVEQLG